MTNKIAVVLSFPDDSKKILIGGVWKTITTMYVLISGVWKTITETKVLVNSTWKLN